MWVYLPELTQAREERLHLSDVNVPRGGRHLSEAAAPVQLVVRMQVALAAVALAASAVSSVMEITCVVSDGNHG